MRVQFLLGPAGSGKTFQCLAGVRSALAACPDGDPLVFLAPKQATFQLERQLLASADLAGFTRLHILSFDRLAQFVLEKLHVAPPKLLSAEGRLMVLRALLRQHDGSLKLLHGSARRPGLAQELGTLLAELQQQQFGPGRLQALAANEKLPRELRDKLHDLALLAVKYAEWLDAHGLQDVNCLLDFAAEKMRGRNATGALPSAATQPRAWRVPESHYQQGELDFGAPPAGFFIGKLWLDGFAEMTPQELSLLAAVVPHCQEATIAFCLENEPTPSASWLSIWSAIGKTYQRCRQQLAALPDCRVEIVPVKREAGRNRFEENSPLAALEANWSLPILEEFPVTPSESRISVTACANPEAEAVFAARQIREFVRANPHHRFRDCAVLVRDLENYHRPLARIFRRYEIPFFLDRRESVAHHPLAELTRNALRTIAGDWQHDDWFAALKAGFLPLPETDLDRLENAALEYGWRGKKWHEPLPDETFEGMRQILFPPFDKFLTQMSAVNFQPNGEQLAAAVRNLWADLGVEQVLERWTQECADEALPPRAAVHATVLAQMDSWLDNVALAFPREPLPLRDWLPILEAGLGNLTVGVIPPALDEVLVGAIDRARNPDLKCAVLLGFNESVFPAAPVTPAILTASDRDELERQSVTLGGNRFDQISRERYLGYIACTRANEQLAVTYARQGADGGPLNPSPFVAQLLKNFPGLETREFSGETDWREAEHPNELTGRITGKSPGQGGASTLLEIPALQALTQRMAQLREPAGSEKLSLALAEELYGRVLRSSVSRLEEFAQCPFRFFVRSGLRANERKLFEVDARERGNFQHDVLKVFHEELQAEGKRWRDLTPAEARARVADIAARQTESHRDGLFLDSSATTFAARAMALALQDFVEVIVGWMRSQYAFDPVAAEIGFGGNDDPAPAWEIELGAGRKLALQGRIDRVDFWRAPDGNALAVVTDYKSGGKKLDSLLVANGLQLQLLGYLGILRQWKNPGALFGVDKIIPAGAFYVSLRGKFEGGGTRDEILADAEAKRSAYRHNGRFDAEILNRLDSRAGVNKGDQFNFRRKQDGDLHANSAEALPAADFRALIDDVEGQLRRLGNEIFAGASQVDPYRKGKETPCEYCDYRAVCRMDAWTQAWRDLRLKPEVASVSETEAI